MQIINDIFLSVYLSLKKFYEMENQRISSLQKNNTILLPFLYFSLLTRATTTTTSSTIYI